MIQALCWHLEKAGSKMEAHILQFQPASTEQLFIFFKLQSLKALKLTLILL